MPRTVDEILRDAARSSTRFDAYGLGAYRALTGEVTVRDVAEQLTTDPTERAALVEHMVASRGEK